MLDRAAHEIQAELHALAGQHDSAADLLAHVHDTIGGLARPNRIVYVASLVDVPGHRTDR